MKLKAIITTLFFIGALFTGTALAADTGATTDRDPDRGATEGPPYDTRGGMAEGQRGVPMQESRPGQPTAGGDMFQDDQIPGMHRAENLMGKNVVSQQGNDLGSIDDLVISENGEVEYIILSRGGTLGMGGEMVPVPWEAANLQRGADDQLTADITEQQLDDAPTFDDYAQIGSESYEQEVHSYFGTEPRTGK